MSLEIHQQRTRGHHCPRNEGPHHGRARKRPRCARRSPSWRRHQRNLVLNLADVDYIDSTGLGALVMCATTVRKAGGNVKLVNLNRRNIELLVMTRLATFFEIFTDERDAVGSYYPDRKIKTFDILDFVSKMKKEE